VDAVLFFEVPAAWRRWLQKHHATLREVRVGFHKRGAGRASITWPESVDEALCFGWIDGVRRSLDAERYEIRFTPRKPTSLWSAANVKRARELTELGRMRSAGLAAFARRKEAKTAVYAYEQRGKATLDAASRKKLRQNEKAWAFFQARPPWYRRTAIWWVISGKQAATRERRLSTLIEDSAQGRTIARLTRKPPSRA
jgi:uncharacterized protein YdeI (YjbR/CyaY-like superfamily)